MAAAELTVYVPVPPVLVAQAPAAGGFFIFLNISFGKLIKSNNFNQSLDNLPNMLFKLIIAGGPQEYEDLDIIYPEFNQPLNDLPDNIREIEICVNHYTQEITKLPQNLEIIMFFTIKFTIGFSKS